MPSDVRIVVSALLSPAGQLFMKWLEDRYQGRRLFDEDPIKMARNVAQYDLVEDLKTYLREGSKHE